MKEQTTTAKKTPKAEYIGFYLETNLYNKIAKAAADDDRTVSDFVRLLVKRGLEKKS